MMFPRCLFPRFFNVAKIKNPTTTYAKLVGEKIVNLFIINLIVSDINVDTSIRGTLIDKLFSDPLS